MVTWIHVGLLQSKSEIIYLPRKFCQIIIHRNPLRILDMSCCHKHEQQRYHNENTKTCIFLHYMCVDIVFPLTKAIPIMFQRVTTYYQTLKTWIGHNFNTLPHSLPYIFFSLAWIVDNATWYHNFNVVAHKLSYIFSQCSMVWSYL